MTTTAPLVPPTHAEPPGRRDNPFVGPESIPPGAAIYGRGRETTSVLNMLVAERIVLLYSPSGAGKTSLVNAGLRPALIDDDFEVLPVASVRHELEQPDGTTRNRYALSIMSSLEQRRPRSEQLSPAELSRLTLHQYLRTRTDLDGHPGNEVLVVDHFEDVLRVDPLDLDAKQEFFTELGEALADRRLWALFVMREDYLAALDPYLRLVPRHFQAQYRLDLLRPDSARQAIVKPIEAAGVRIDDDAVTRLLADLRRVNVLQGDEVRTAESPYIEPVQLQVTCHRLWESLDPGQTRIRVSDVESLGDVDSALRTYYRASVAKVAHESGVPERSLREWFQHDLVTPNGLRTQVITGPGGTGVLDRLVATHLLRAEERHGAIWYELSHDRLVQPVAADNARWADENLTEFERAAQLWDRQRRPDGLLLADDALAAEERALAEGRAHHDDVERAFFVRSWEARAARDREEASVRRTRRALAAAVVGLLVAVAGGATAAVMFARAEAEARTSAATAVAAEGQRLVDADPEAALMLAAEVMPDDGPLDPLVRNLIGSAVIAAPVAGQVLGPKGLITSTLATSHDGRWTVLGASDPTGGLDGQQIVVLETATGDMEDVFDPPPALASPGVLDSRTALVSVGVSDNGHVAWVDASGDVWWWDRSERTDSAEIVFGSAESDFAQAVVMAPDGESVGIVFQRLGEKGSWSQLIARFSPDGTPIGSPFVPGGTVSSAWSWDGDLWVVGTPSGVTLGRLSDDSFAPLPEATASSGAGYSVETSRDGRRALAIDPGGRVRVWDTGTRELVWDRAASARIAALDADGSLLAVSWHDARVEVFDLATAASVGWFDLADARVAGSLWFLPDDRDRLVMTDSSGLATVRDWRSEGGTTLPALSVAATPEGLTAVNSDAGTTVWTPKGELTALLPTGPTTGGIAFYGDEGVVVARGPTGDSDAAVEVWPLDDGDRKPSESVDLPQFRAPVAVAAAGDGTGLAVSDGSFVAVVREGRDRCVLKPTAAGDVIALDYTSPETLVVSRSDSVVEHDLTRPDCPAGAELASMPQWDVLDTAVDPVTGTVAVLDLGNQVRFFVDGEEQDDPVQALRPSAREIVLLPGADHLVLRYLDGAMSIHDLTRDALDPLRLERGAVADLATGRDSVVMAMFGRSAPADLPLADDSLRDIARDLPAHALTDAECARLLGDLCRR